jgi:Ca2+-binding EF-hand superfamily protein
MGCVSSNKKLSKSDLEFLEENTEFTKDQIIEWYEGFIVSMDTYKMYKKELEKTLAFFSYIYIKQSSGSSAL